MAKAVAKKSQNEVAAVALFEEDAGVGTELGQEDLALPFLKIVSALDSMLDDEDFEGKKGDIYNTVTGKIYSGKKGVQVVPCAYQRRYIQWAPRGQGTGAPIAIFAPGDKMPPTKRDEKDNREYIIDGNGEYIEETHQHFVVIVNEDGTTETALIAMKSTQLKKSRKWNSMIASTTLMGKNGPFTPARFSHLYHLKTLKEENSKGFWDGWEMSRIGPLTESPDVYRQAKQFAESITAGDVVVKHSSDEETVTDPGF